ncbi:MAG: TIGR01777 family protein [Candidatus Eisenbacteria bacterium]|nr:TIGR01777 family protein [Candidatus Latescibacterota bacterium]MBD3301382.1 TIGR01777 family protein [Candidatus Eisenbacteria bacterium]
MRNAEPRGFVRRARIPVPASELYAWHARPGAFARLKPPFEPVEVVSAEGGIAAGARVVLRVGPRPFRFIWRIEHRDTIPGRQFADVQVSGPFRSYRHVHRFMEDGPDASVLEDRIEYALPFRRWSEPLLAPIVEARFHRLFAYRHEVTRRDLIRHAGRKGQGTMRVLVSGSTGFIGSALVPFLTTGGHEVVRLVRGERNAGPDTIVWDPASGALDRDALEGFDAVIHLSGENLASGRWTEAKKHRLTASRVETTRLLAKTLAGLAQPPRTFVCASAIGYYGSRGEEVLTEKSTRGEGFLAEMTARWEAAADPARAAGIRVVHLRNGLVLHPSGGFLEKLLLPFRVLGGWIGDGRQYLSWITRDDLCSLVLFALDTPSLEGPINVVTPNPVRNRTFSETLGRVLRRPVLVPLPAALLRLALGEMAEETVLVESRVEPERALAAGFRFEDPDLEPALRRMLGKPAADPPS